jgi:hypothetical protein
MIQPATLTEQKATGGQRITTYFNPDVFNVGNDAAGKQTMKILKLVKLVVLTVVHVGGTDVDDITAIADIQWQSQRRDLHFHFHSQLALILKTLYRPFGAL